MGDGNEATTDRRRSVASVPSDKISVVDKGGVEDAEGCCG